ncbi:hypothetical protein KC19_VG153900 [Ceratodon purpureus]|uniref:Uncharacterized protein n=1 Tax=Ceratodon purpureus TaxID=3225 RepID=A0A8T0HR01_CERPU|nr:hypothetical protein KC19_VG153900 [Ceratodon purpureus]
MVKEVLHTQRDFKNILMQLLNNSTCNDTAPRIVSNNAYASTEAALQDLPPCPTVERIPPVTDLNARDEPRPSWMSADTVILSPNTRNTLRPRSAHYARTGAVSRDVSDHSITNGSINDSAAPLEGYGLQSTSSVPHVEAGGPEINEDQPRGHPLALLDLHQPIPIIRAMATRASIVTSEVESQGLDSALHDLALKFPVNRRYRSEQVMLPNSSGYKRHGCHGGQNWRKLEGKGFTFWPPL